jgi:hypothetical protein
MWFQSHQGSRQQGLEGETQAEGQTDRSRQERGLQALSSDGAGPWPGTSSRSAVLSLHLWIWSPQVHPKHILHEAPCWSLWTCSLRPQLPAP